MREAKCPSTGGETMTVVKEEATNLFTTQQFLNIHSIPILGSTTRHTTRCLHLPTITTTI